MSASAVGGSTGRAVGKAGLGGVARHALHQRAEARLLRVGPGLAPARDAHDDELGVAGVQHGGAEAHPLERAGAVVLDQHLRALGERQQQLLGAGLAQVQRHALLVAGVLLPEQRVALDAPMAQGIALVGVLDLDDLGAEVGELEGDHVAGDQPRQVEHGDAVERAGGVRSERDHGRPWGWPWAAGARKASRKCPRWNGPGNKGSPALVADRKSSNASHVCERRQGWPRCGSDGSRSRTTPTACGPATGPCWGAPSR